MVRDAIDKVKKVFPEWRPRPDSTIEPPRKDELTGCRFGSDYLNDLF
jgi:hypothetical protein